MHISSARLTSLLASNYCNTVCNRTGNTQLNNIYKILHCVCIAATQCTVNIYENSLLQHCHLYYCYCKWLAYIHSYRKCTYLSIIITFGRKILDKKFDKSPAIHQIHQNFLPPEYCIVYLHMHILLRCLFTYNGLVICICIVFNFISTYVAR